MTWINGAFRIFRSIRRMLAEDMILDVIRINSQSGKGGVNYILKQSFGISLPEKMREEVGYLVKDVSDKAHKELTPDLIYRIFEDNYINAKPVFTVDECHFKQEDGIIAEASDPPQ